MFHVHNSCSPHTHSNVYAHRTGTQSHTHTTVHTHSTGPHKFIGTHPCVAWSSCPRAEGEDKLPLGLKEVEPPEDMDVPEMDIDPSMLIWKAVQESRRRAIEESRANAHAHMMPEEDHDASYHLTEAQLIQGQQPAQGAPVPAFIPETNPKYDQAEPDMDKVYHNFPDPASQWVVEEGGPLEQEQGIPGTRRGRYDQAEVDLDDLYHGNMGQGPAETQVQEDMDDMSMLGHRGYAVPEEDLDDLYHK